MKNEGTRTDTGMPSDVTSDGRGSHIPSYPDDYNGISGCRNTYNNQRINGIIKYSDYFTFYNNNLSDVAILPKGYYKWEKR